MTNEALELAMATLAATPEGRTTLGHMFHRVIADAGKQPDENFIERQLRKIGNISDTWPQWRKDEARKRSWSE